MQEPSFWDDIKEHKKLLKKCKFKDRIERFQIKLERLEDIEV